MTSPWLDYRPDRQEALWLNRILTHLPGSHGSARHPPRTGFSVSIDEHEAMDMGIRAFVKKPILRHRLPAAVYQAIDRRDDDRQSLTFRYAAG
jgi:hypothetical protein